MVIRRVEDDKKIPVTIAFIIIASLLTSSLVVDKIYSTQIDNLKTQIGILNANLQMQDDTINALKENIKKTSSTQVLIFDGTGEIIKDVEKDKIITLDVKTIPKGRNNYGTIIISASSDVPLNYNPILQSIDTYDLPPEN